MRLAFVLRLGNETRPSEGLFEGWIEEVDSSIEKRFRSTEELLQFLSLRFEVAATPGGKVQVIDGEPETGGKKRSNRERKRS